MPPLHVHPVLPVEILNEIFSYLDLPSVRRILRVNSLFRALAQPRAYQYATMTELGVFFPGTEPAYPFSEGFGPGLPVSVLSQQEREKLVTQLKRIDIKRHPGCECAGGVKPGSMLPPQLEVWNIELHSCQLRKPKNDDWWYTDHFDGTFCQYTLDLVQWNKQAPRKIVVKDIPRDDGYFYRSYSHHSDSFSPHTHVSAVYSQPCPRTPEVPHDYSELALGADELWISTCHRLEVIIWTEWPGQAWIPRCRFATDQRRSGTCRDTERTVWSTLAARVVDSSVREFVVVNSAAILPAASTVLEHELELRREQARMQAQHAWGFQKELDHEAQEWDGFPLETYEFITMEEWIGRGGWEDAFTLEEMRPWLDKMQSSGAKNSLPSVVHVYRSSPESESELDLDVE